MSRIGPLPGPGLLPHVGLAGLVETLSGDGPFTVFAPTDDAFAKLPAGTVESLLKPENREKLVSILTYHVVPGRVTSDQVVKVGSAATVNGQSLSINAGDSGGRPGHPGTKSGHFAPIYGNRAGEADSKAAKNNLKKCRPTANLTC